MVWEQQRQHPPPGCLLPCPGMFVGTERRTRRALPWGRPSGKAGGAGRGGTWTPRSWGRVFLGDSTGPGRGRGRRRGGAFREPRPLAAPASRGANTQKGESRRGREARGLPSYPPAPKQLVSYSWSRRGVWGCPQGPQTQRALFLQGPSHVQAPVGCRDRPPPPALPPWSQEL